jgi:hypothetical protein
LLQHLRGERVDVRAADGDADVGQVRVDIELAVPRSRPGGTGRGHALADEGDGQVAHGVHRRTVPVRRDDLGDADRPGVQPGTVEVVQVDPGGRGQREPMVCGIVQRPGCLLGVHVDQTEAAADDGVADLADG